MNTREMNHKGFVLRLLVRIVSMAWTITTETVNCTRKPNSDHLEDRLYDHLYKRLDASSLNLEIVLNERPWRKLNNSHHPWTLVWMIKAGTWRLFVLQKGHQIWSNCISVQLDRWQLRERMLVERYLVQKTHYNNGCYKNVPKIRAGWYLLAVSG